MGLVARGAHSAENGGVDVGFGKAGVSIGMTGEADSVLPVLEEPLPLGAVRIMAGRAHPFLKGSVGCPCRQGGFRLGMTGEAQFAPFRNRQLGMLRGMRRVTGEAPFPFVHRLMRPGNGFGLLLVAFFAQKIPRTQQQRRTG